MPHMAKKKNYQNQRQTIKINDTTPNGNCGGCCSRCCCFCCCLWFHSKISVCLHHIKCGVKREEERGKAREGGDRYAKILKLDFAKLVRVGNNNNNNFSSCCRCRCCPAPSTFFSMIAKKKNNAPNLVVPQRLCP